MSEKPTLNMTSRAKQYLLNMIDKDPNATALRLSIKTTGCSGYMYQPELVEEGSKDDVVVRCDDALTVYIHAPHLELIDDTQIDLIDKELGQKQLTFVNPRAESLCGCGESFSLKEESEE